MTTTTTMRATKYSESSSTSREGEEKTEKGLSKTES
jgi:hypothetical protein